MCWSLFLIELQALRPTYVFSYEHCEIFNNIYYEEHLWMAASDPLVYALIHFRPIFPFYTPWKRQKTKGFLTFYRGYEEGTLAWNGLNETVLSLGSQGGLYLKLVRWGLGLLVWRVLLISFLLNKFLDYLLHIISCHPIKHGFITEIK